MKDDRNNEQVGEEKIIPTMCSSHCGGVCLLRVHAKKAVGFIYFPDIRPSVVMKSKIKPV